MQLLRSDIHAAKIANNLLKYAENISYIYAK
jgi:hypothetical protein